MIKIVLDSWFFNKIKQTLPLSKYEKKKNLPQPFFHTFI